jgi:protein-S-isoprenylcysteine O-methyltransferase Ste14
MTSDPSDTVSLDQGARVPPMPPPMYYGAAFVGGMLLRSLTVPWSIGGQPATSVLGGAILAGGAGLALTGVSAVFRHHTTIVPHHPVSALVTTGPYRWTRNPMYTGLAFAYVGGALLAGTWWPLATLPLALLAIRRLVIAPEERYLTEAFGDAYSDYQARVRRWF